MVDKKNRKVLGGPAPVRSAFTLRAQPEFPISEEVAKEQVVQLLAYYDIDPDKILADTEGAAGASFERALEQIQTYVRRGVLEVVTGGKEGIKVVHNLINGDEALEYVEIKARHKIAMESFDPGKGYSRIYAFMGALSGVGKAGIEKLSARDLAVVEVLGTVFLAA